MKKVLFGASALLAATAFSANANAAEPLKLQLGGYMDWYVAAVDTDDDVLKGTAATAKKLNTFDVIGDGEVHFLGETVLDNGVKVGVQIEMEGGNRSSGDAIDESFVTVDTSYGRVMIGSTDNVGVLMHASAPDVGRIDVEESNLWELIEEAGVAAGTKNTSMLNATWINTDGDANKISYITPTMYGTTFGVSYIPGGATAGEDITGGTLVQTNFEEAYVMSGMYSGEFSGVGVTVTGAYGTFNQGGSEARTEWSTGTNLTYGGLTFGAGFRHVDANQNTTMGVGSSEDGYAWNAGVSYEAGPYGVSLAYMKSAVEGATVNNVEDEAEMYMLSGKYNLGAGVDTFATLSYVELEDEAVATKDTETWAFMTGIALAF